MEEIKILAGEELTNKKRKGYYMKKLDSMNSESHSAESKTKKIAKKCSSTISKEARERKKMYI